MNNSKGGIMTPKEKNFYERYKNYVKKPVDFSESQELQELNAKLALWRWPDNKILDYPDFHCIYVVSNEDNSTGETINYFTSSVDSCRKWLVPELNKQGIYIVIGQLIDGSYDIDFYFKSSNKRDRADRLYQRHGMSNDNDLALALCKAIEQVRDNASK